MTPYYDQSGVRIFCGDALTVLRERAEKSVHCCVTSPPYWGLRDYGVAGELGLEKTPDEFVARMVEVFREVRRVLRDDGTLWLNIGDSYATGGGAVGRCPGGGEQGARFLRQGHINTQPNRMPLPGLKPKDLVGIPWMLAFALRADGWYLRSEIIWHKPNPMPESVTDRPTKAHEQIFLLAKSEKYYYDADAIAEPITGHAARKLTWEERRSLGEVLRHGLAGAASSKSGSYAVPDAGRNKRSVWTVSTEPFPGAHFATFPTKLIEPCILAGCPPLGIVLDPFTGAGTTALVAKENGCRFLGIELNPEYCEIAGRRLRQEVFDLQAETPA